MEILLPCDDLYMRSVVTQRPSRTCGPTERLSFAIEKQIALLLRKEAELHRFLDESKRALKIRYDWTNLKAFGSVDSRREGSLNFENIMNFCRLNNFRATESQVIGIVRRLDIDADQRITYEEWGQFMDYQEPLPVHRHADPNSPEREDSRFRHTSPPKTS